MVEDENSDGIRLNGSRPGGIESQKQKNESISSIRESLSATGIGDGGIERLKNHSLGYWTRFSTLDFIRRFVPIPFLRNSVKLARLQRAARSSRVGSASHLWRVLSLYSSGDIEKSREDPRNLYNKDIVVENLVKFVEDNQSFDRNTGPDCRQTGLEVDNRNRNENRSHITHKSMVRIGVVEGWFGCIKIGEIVRRVRS
ncbi:hypothetical protein Tco_0211872 [Tanacetum coccineum]